MTFEHITFIYALPVVLGLLILLHRFITKKRREAITAFISNRLLEELTASHSQKKFHIKFSLWTLSILLILTALARPQWGSSTVEQTAKGIDVIFALDVSKSMLAQDFKPNRLERAKLAILDFVKKLHTDRIGLVLFTQDAFIQCPLTLDYNAFKLSLEEASPSSLSKGGTNIAEAIRTADDAFEKGNNYKLLIIVSDGEDLEQDGIKEAKHAAGQGMLIYTLGTGSSKGELIPIRKPNGQEDFLRNKEGKLVKTSLDTKTLSQIAEVTGGTYAPIGNTGKGLELIHHTALSKIPESELRSTIREIRTERFQYPLALAILLLMIESVLSTRKRTNKNTGLKGLLFVLIISAWTTPKSIASPQEAFAAFNNEDYQHAAMLYQEEAQKKPTPELLYNLGSSLYKAQDYENSIKALESSLETDDLSLQENAFYNLGNAHFKSAEPSFESNPSLAIPLLEKAIQNYNSSIELNPESSDTQKNLRIAEEILKKLKEQQENQNPENNDQQENQEDNQDNSDQDQEENNEEENEEEQEKESNQNQDSQTQDDQQENESSKNSQEKMDELTAQQILDALKNDEKKLPAFEASTSGSNKQDDEYEDW